MTLDQFKSLKNGDQVEFKADGQRGVVTRQDGFAVFEIVWNDGERSLVHSESKTDMDWVVEGVEFVSTE